MTKPNKNQLMRLTKDTLVDLILNPPSPEPDLQMSGEEVKDFATHHGDCKTLMTVLDNANAMGTKAVNILNSLRRSLELLKDEQHPNVLMNAPYHLSTTNGQKIAPSYLIEMEINQINALLGDRP